MTRDFMGRKVMGRKVMGRKVMGRKVMGPDVMGLTSGLSLGRAAAAFSSSDGSVGILIHAALRPWERTPLR